MERIAGTSLDFLIVGLRVLAKLLQSIECSRAGFLASAAGQRVVRTNRRDDLGPHARPLVLLLLWQADTLAKVLILAAYPLPDVS